MRCTSPRKVGFRSDGTTLAWSEKDISKEYAGFQVPCGKCIECRLEYARSWAVRCVHEAQMHEKNSFITLTYSDEHLKSPKLDYTDFQLFMKKLRKLQKDPMGLFVTGEYGEKNKRPHWHAIIFNWSPADLEPYQTSDRGDKLYKSDLLDRTWGKNDNVLRPSIIGEVTFESAGYCARYAAKKLVHGRDATHDYEPISRKSSKHAIGKKFLEAYWPDVFSYGKCILSDGSETGIPRYYEKWLKEKQPDAWVRYVTQVKPAIIEKAMEKSSRETEEYLDNVYKRNTLWRKNPLSPLEVKKKLAEEKFKKLQEHLKL